MSVDKSLVDFVKTVPFYDNEVAAELILGTLEDDFDPCAFISTIMECVDFEKVS